MFQSMGGAQTHRANHFLHRAYPFQDDIVLPSNLIRPRELQHNCGAQLLFACVPSAVDPAGTVCYCLSGGPVLQALPRNQPLP